MSEERYKPPATRVQDPPPSKGSAIKGVVLGFLVDMGGTLLFGVVTSIAYGMALAAAGRSPDEISASLSHPEADPLVSAISLLGGVAFSVLGGFVCERIARQGTYKLGVILSLVLVIVGFGLGGESAYSWAMNGLLIFLTVGSVLLGTRLAFQSRGS
jgi:hypothetical protein